MVFFRDIDAILTEKLIQVHASTKGPERPNPTPTLPAKGGGAERLTEQHNVRIRPSVKDRLSTAVDKLRYETGDRSITIASITDQAIDAYLRERGC